MAHGAFGFGVQPARCTPGAQLDEEQDVEPLQPDRLDGEEIDGQDALAVYAHELAPRHLPALPCRSETGGPEPRTHGRH